MENKKKDDVSATGVKDPSPQKVSSTPDWRTKRLKNIFRTCKVLIKGGCPLCKQLLCICCYHAKDCKKPACRFAYCIPIKEKLKKQKTQQLPEKQKARPLDLKKRIIAMEKGKVVHNKVQQEAKHSKSSTQISSADEPRSKLHSPPPDPTSSSGPPVGVVQEVQADASKEAAQAPKAEMKSNIPDHTLKAENVTSRENSADVQNQKAENVTSRENSADIQNQKAENVTSQENSADVQNQKAENVTSRENSADVQNQKSHQETQLNSSDSKHNTPVHSSGGSNSEPDSIDSTTEMLNKVL